MRIFIATKTKSNVRELEGALTRLIAVSSLTGQPISLGMAQQTLKYLDASPERRITIESIVRAVAEKFALQPAQLKMKSNTRQIAYPRQIAMYLAKELTHASLPEIGRVLRWKASHDRSPLGSENRGPSPARRGFEQPYPEPNRFITIDL